MTKQEMNAYERNISMNEITQTNLQKLEEICIELELYLKHNEISNIKDLALVQ